MLFRQSELFRQYIFGTFFCDPKITAFFRIKLLVFDFFFELLRLGSWSYSDNQVVDPLQPSRERTLSALRVGTGKTPHTAHAWYQPMGQTRVTPLSLLLVNLYTLCVPSRAAAGENATLWYQRVTTKSRALAEPWFSMSYSNADI